MLKFYGNYQSIKIKCITFNLIERKGGKETKENSLNTIQILIKAGQKDKPGPNELGRYSIVNQMSSHSSTGVHLYLAI